MSMFKKNVNLFRKKTLKVLTRKVGHFNPREGILVDRSAVKEVLIIRPNHRLGNQLLMTPLVQEVAFTFPNARIDLFTGKVSPVIFSNYGQVDLYIRIPRKPFKELFKYVKVWLMLRQKHYDFVINVDKNSSSGRIATMFARGKYKLYGEFVDKIKSEQAEYMHIAKNPVYYFRHCLSKLGYDGTNREVPCLDLRLSAEEIAAGKEKLGSLVEQEARRTISLYTFATGAKCYSESWWSDFYEQLKLRFPDFNILEILPVENISMIGFRAPSFYSRDIREMAAVMANTVVFIGADCGIMHLASAAPVPTFGFFSVTDPQYYAPYNLGSKAFITNGLKVDTIFQELEKLLII